MDFDPENPKSLDDIIEESKRKNFSKKKVLNRRGRIPNRNRYRNFSAQRPQQFSTFKLSRKPVLRFKRARRFNYSNSPLKR